MPEHHKNLHEVHPVEDGFVQQPSFLVIASDRRHSCRRERGNLLRRICRRVLRTADAFCLSQEVVATGLAFGEAEPVSCRSSLRRCPARQPTIDNRTPAGITIEPPAVARSFGDYC